MSDRWLSNFYTSLQLYDICLSLWGCVHVCRGEGGSMWLCIQEEKLLLTEGPLCASVWAVLLTSSFTLTVILWGRYYYPMDRVGEEGLLSRTSSFCFPPSWKLATQAGWRKLKIYGWRFGKIMPRAWPACLWKAVLYRMSCCIVSPCLFLSKLEEGSGYLTFSCLTLENLIV